MNKLTKFVNAALASYYKKRMKECFADAIAADQNGHPAIYFAMHRRYLNYERKWTEYQSKL